jgi:glucosamine--fructose-6-phosphate aminotransferase (isomerizing)
MLPKNKTFPHAMLREVFEQPDAIAATLAAYTDGNSLREDTFSALDRRL